jgi:hypothetical protein
MTTRCAAVALALLASPAAGCAAGSEAPDEVGYVLLDHEAQASGRLSQHDWEGAPLLPVALDVAEPAAFSSTAGRTEIALRPGMLAWVHGAGGAVEWRALGDDVRDDGLLVHGTRDAAAALAQRLAGQVEGGGDGVWTVAAPGVFERTSFLEPPAGVTEVTPAARLDLAPVASPFEKHAALAPVAPVGAGAPAAVRAARLVGLYMAGERALLLDAAGGFAIEESCGGGDTLEQGRWHSEGDEVVLEGAAGRRVLSYDPVRGELGEADGARFSSALVDSIVAAMPREEP